MMLFRSVRAGISILILCLGSLLTGCESIPQRIAYDLSDEKKQGMSRMEYDMTIWRQQEEEQRKAEDLFRMTREQ